MLELPHFKAAAVQTAPVFLDTDATVDKAVRLIGEDSPQSAYPSLPGRRLTFFAQDPVPVLH